MDGPAFDRATELRAAAMALADNEQPWKATLHEANRWYVWSHVGLVDRMEISTIGCCAYCDSLNGRVVLIDHEARAPSLPGLCTAEWCNCDYIPSLPDEPV